MQATQPPSSGGTKRRLSPILVSSLTSTTSAQTNSSPLESFISKKEAALKATPANEDKENESPVLNYSIPKAIKVADSKVKLEPTEEEEDLLSEDSESSEEDEGSEDLDEEEDLEDSSSSSIEDVLEFNQELKELEEEVKEEEKAVNAEQEIVIEEEDAIDPDPVDINPNELVNDKVKDQIYEKVKQRNLRQIEQR